MKNSALLSVLVATFLVLAAGPGACEQSASDAPAVSPVQVQPETLSFKPEQPLSLRALVVQPTPIKGVASWTLESRRHRGQVMASAVNPRGTLLATGGIDGTIRIWNLADGRLVRALLGHDNYVISLAWSPCGTVIASAGAWDGTVRLWAPKSGQMLRNFKGQKTPVLQVAWSGDGTRLAAACGISGHIVMWDSDTDKITTIAEAGQYVSALAWSPDSKRLAFAGQSLAPTFFDLADPKSATPLIAPQQAAYPSVAWSPDSQKLAAAGSTNTLVWNLTDKTIEKTFAGYSYSACFSPDGKQLATAGITGVQLWNLESGKPGAKLPGVFTRLIWPAGGAQLIGVSAVNVATLGLAEAKPLLSFESAGYQPPLWTLNRPIVTGMGDKKLSLWDAATGKYLRDLEGHTAIINAAAWSRDGKTLASVGYDNTVRLWEGASGESSQVFKGHTAPILCVAWAASGRTLATGGLDKTVRVWDAEGRNPQTFEGHTGPVQALAWSPLGNVLASGSDDATIRLWNAKTGQTTRTISTIRPVRSLAWVQAGKTPILAFGTTDEVVSIVDAFSGKSLADLRSAGSPPAVSALAWLPSGGLLLSGRGNHTMQLWDVERKKIVHHLAAMAPVQYAAWAGNGSILVGGNTDRTVRFWDAATGKIRGMVLAEKDHVALVSPDGHWRIDTGKTPDMVAVAHVDQAQLMMSLEDFATKFRWKNNAAQVKLPTR